MAVFTTRSEFAAEIDWMCSVRGCCIAHASTKENGEPYQFFSFPRERSRLAHWTRFANPDWPSWRPKPKNAICERHFPAEAIVERPPNLMNGADPSLFPGNSEVKGIKHEDEDEEVSGDEHADGNGDGEFDSSVDDGDPSKTTSANGGIAVDEDGVVMPRAKEHPGERPYDPNYRCCPSEIPEMRRRIVRMEQGVDTLFVLLRNLLQTTHQQTMLKSANVARGGATVPPPVLRPVHAAVNADYASHHGVANTPVKKYCIGQAPTLKRTASDGGDGEQNKKTPVKKPKKGLTNSPGAAQAVGAVQDSAVDQRQWWKCPRCEARFESRGNLSNHARIHDRDPPGGYAMPCRQCDAILRSETAVMQHMKAEHGEARLECPQCGQNFERRSRLVKHINAHRCRSSTGKGSGAASATAQYRIGDGAAMPPPTMVATVTPLVDIPNIPSPLGSVGFIPDRRDPLVDQDSMSLLHPESRAELKAIEVQMHLARAVLLLQTHAITKQKFRMLGPDWIQLVDDQDIMRALELLRKCGVLSLNGASTSSSKGLAYNKVLPEDLSDSGLLARFNVTLDEYAQTFAR